MIKEAGSFFGIVMVLMIGAYVFIAGQGGNMFGAYATGHSSAQLPAAGASVVGSPSLSAAQVDAILKRVNSPAYGTGQTFYNDSLQYGVDDAYALSFFHHESTYGLYGAAVQTHSIGNINCTSGYTCIGRFRAYSSWQAGIDDWYQLIKNVYVDQGLKTVEAIIPHYAPNSDGNSESGYIAAIKGDVSSWRSA